MLNKYFPIVFLILSLNGFSQERLTWFTNTLKTDTTTPINNIYPIVNKENGDIAIFLVDENNINGYLLNNQFESKNKLTLTRTNTKYQVLIGNSISDENNFRVFFSNNSKNKFATSNFSFDKNTSDFKELNIDMSNERFIQTISYENKFFLVTIEKLKSILYLYSFDKNNYFKKQTIDLTKERFVDQESLGETLYRIIKNSNGTSGFQPNVEITKIEENNPNTIELTSEKAKFYQKDNLFLISLDYNKNYTQIISVNLNDFNYTVKTRIKPLSEINNFEKQSNSYINGNYLYLFTTTKKEFSFTVQNIDSVNLIKTYSAKIGESIDFKNSPIILEGGVYNSYKELEKTKKYLRKIKSSNIGISVYKFNNDYQITLGGTKEIKQGSPMMMPMGGLAMSIGSLTANLIFNPTLFAFDSYSNSLSTYILCRFNNQLEHIKGNYKLNVFDKIKNEINGKKNIDSKTVFKYKDYYILGTYANYSRTLQLQKFKD